jgi:hypothetical protein
MAWQPPEWARSAQQLSDRWLGTCRKFSGHQQFFQSLDWGDRLSQLLAVACARAAFDKRLNARSRDLLALVEQEADGLVSHDTIHAYCRSEGPFCRGCWILDALLDKRR